MKRIIYISKRINGNKSTWIVPQKKEVSKKNENKNIFTNI